MNSKVDPMVAGWFNPKQLAVQHMRKPGERMPVAGVRGGECPLNAPQSYSSLNIWISHDITIPATVIKGHETQMAHWPIDRQRDAGQQQANQYIPAHR
ncbi:MAG: hypothetical protein ABSH11_14060 [Verrucomicrobiota bacterium]